MVYRSLIKSLDLAGATPPKQSAGARPPQRPLRPLPKKSDDEPVFAKKSADEPVFAKKSETVVGLVRDALSTLPDCPQEFKGAVVQPFGSRVTMLCPEGEDLDITISAAGVDVPDRTSVMQLLQGLHSALGVHAQIENLFYNGRARLPLLRVYLKNCQRDVDGDVDQVDITADNRLGLVNTQLVRAYADAFEGFGGIAMEVKKWAKDNGLKASGRGFLGGYTWVVTVMCFVERMAKFSTQREATGQPFSALCSDGAKYKIHPWHPVRSGPGSAKLCLASFLDFLRNAILYGWKLSPCCKTVAGVKWSLQDPFDPSHDLVRNCTPWTLELLCTVTSAPYAFSLPLRAQSLCLLYVMSKADESLVDILGKLPMILRQTFVLYKNLEPSAITLAFAHKNNMRNVECALWKVGAHLYITHTSQYDLIGAVCRDDLLPSFESALSYKEQIRATRPPTPPPPKTQEKLDAELPPPPPPPYLQEPDVAAGVGDLSSCCSKEWWGWHCSVCRSVGDGRGTQACSGLGVQHASPAQTPAEHLGATSSKSK